MPPWGGAYLGFGICEPGMNSRAWTIGVCIPISQELMRGGEGCLCRTFPLRTDCCHGNTRKLLHFKAASQVKRSSAFANIICHRIMCKVSYLHWNERSGLKQQWCINLWGQQHVLHQVLQWAGHQITVASQWEKGLPPAYWPQQLTSHGADKQSKYTKPQFYCTTAIQSVEDKKALSRHCHDQWKNLIEKCSSVMWLLICSPKG